MDWGRVYVTIWYSMIGSMLLYELVMYFDSKPWTPPLTDVLIAETPWWITLPFLGWLFIHFASRYLGHPVL